MIFTVIIGLLLWLFFGRKGLAWGIWISAIVFSIGLFVAPPVKTPPSCTEDLTAVPMKLCAPIGGDFK